MNTPDNRPEAVLDRILEKKGLVPQTTPETEWREAFVNQMIAWEEMTPPEEKAIQRPEMILEYVTTLLTSRDTYWKERVRKVIEDKITHNAQYLRKPPQDGETNFQTKRRRANNNYINGQRQACDDLLQALDNLK